MENETIIDGNHTPHAWISGVPCRAPSRSRSLARRLQRLVAPWHVLDYPGMIGALAGLLGVRYGTAETLLKPNGDRKLSAAKAWRAEKICRGLALELIKLADDLAAHARARERARQSQSRGMLDVRIRDTSGIPRRGRHADNEKAKRMGYLPLSGKPRDF